MTDTVVCDYDGLVFFFHFSPLVFSPRLPKILGAAEICSADGSLAFYISLEGLGKKPNTICISQCSISEVVETK